MLIACPKCKSYECKPTGERSGEVVCLSCHYLWSDPELSASVSRPFEQPYVVHLVISPADQRKMEAASGFRLSLPPKTTKSAIDTMREKLSPARLAELLEDSLVLQVVLMVLAIIVLAIIVTVVQNYV